jgi:hypothetical protein
MSRYRSDNVGRTLTKVHRRPSADEGRAPNPGTRPRGALPLLAEAVELAVLHAADEGVPLVRREAENRPAGVAAVANADLASGQVRHLNAVAVRVAQRAFHPLRLTSERRHSYATPH